MSSHVPELALITLIAAVVNGALGYGFSSITVPLALFFVANRVLNPALVLVEVVLNGYALWVNREALPQVRRRMLPVVAGLAPGIAVGTLALALVQPEWVKLWTFGLLLPRGSAYNLIGLEAQLGVSQRGASAVLLLMIASCLTLGALRCRR